MRIVTLPSTAISAHASHGVTMDFLPRVVGAERSGVHIAHIAADGTLGEHPAVAQQVFAVLDGRGEVAVDGGPRRPIDAGQAAIWEPGEVHQSWALTDLVAVIVETSGALDIDEHFLPAQHSG